MNRFFPGGTPANKPLVLGDDPAALPVLRDLLNDEDENVKGAAIVALDSSPADVAIPILLQALNHEHPRIRMLAAASLPYACSDSVPKEVLPRLLNMLTDPDKQVRGAVGESLKEIGLIHPESVPQLIVGLHDPNPDLRMELVDALIRIAINSEARETKLIALAVSHSLWDRNEQVRSAAVRALEIIGGEPAIEALNEALHDQSPEVRTIASETLKEIRRATPR
jgi:HEAT repeat protein